MTVGPDAYDAPIEDVLEQRQAVSEEPADVDDTPAPPEADPADVWEQRMEVAIDDEL
jgi:hypothetical protein